MIKIDKYATMEEANFKIQGGIVGGVSTTGTIAGLVGLAITFTAPAGTHTFTQPDGVTYGAMRFVDIKAQLEDSITGLVVTSINGKLGFKSSSAEAVTLGSEDEPARELLGFPNNVAISGEYLNGPSGEAPKFLEFLTEFGGVYIAKELA